MKLLINLIFFLFSITCFSQSGIFTQASFKTKNDFITSPDSLSKQLTARCNTELEKVRSIFNWITDNIEYNTVRKELRYTPYQTDDVEADYDADTAYKSLDERVARITLKRRYSLCDGYARLFKCLCDFAGIKSVVITGYARTNMGSSQFRCNHKWNAVMIDSNWYLLDATWASGYINFAGDKFIRDYNGIYFLTPPKYFVQDHYPDDVKWTLLDDPPTLSEFNRSPFKQPSFNYKIVSYQPSKGIIHTSVGDTITVTLETIDDKKNLFLSDIKSIDSTQIAFADSSSRANKTYTVKGNKVSAYYVVNNEDAQWLQVIYNADVILRYKLNIRKEPFNYPPVIIKEIAINK